MTSNNIRVVCRFRPQNAREIAEGGRKIVTITGTAVRIQSEGSAPHDFAFDQIFDENATQQQVYESVAKPLVADIMRGYNGTLLAYGQTSSGKTHTMMGPEGGKLFEDPELRGLIPRIVETIFNEIAAAPETLEFLVKATFVELYMERIRDLLDLSRTNLPIREDKTKGIWIDGCSELYCSSVEEVMDVVRTGLQNRAIAPTKMNFESSRSHAIFLLQVQQRNLADGSSRSGKLFLVDLAGSEKVQKTGAEGQALEEAKMINKSLSTLGNVINALTDGKSTHVPYRDSKLTRLLQDSLGGNSRTTLIINCSPSSFNEAETLSTLRFGSRAKNIKNKPKINQELSPAELKNLLERANAEIARLRALLSAGGQGQAHAASAPALLAASADEEARLRERIAELEQLLQSREEERASADEAWAAKLEATREELSQERNHALQTAERLAALERDFERHRYEAREKALSFEQLRQENAALRKQLAEAHALIEDLRHRESVARREKERLEKELADARQAAAAAGGEAAGTAAAPALSSSPALRGDALRRSLLAAPMSKVEKVRAELQGEPAAGDQAERLRQLQELVVQLQASNATLLEQARARAADQASGEDPRDQEIARLRRELEEARAGMQTEERVQRLENELRQVREKAERRLGELKETLLRDIQNRCEKVIELEMLLDEAREQYEALLRDSRSPHARIAQLENRLETLSQAHRQSLDAIERMKAERDVAEKKLQARAERIAALEAALQSAQERVTRMSQAHEVELARYRQLVESVRAKAALRVAKPVRGGVRTQPDNTPSTPVAASEDSRSSGTETPNKSSSSFWGSLFSSSKRNPSSPSVTSPRKDDPVT